MQKAILLCTVMDLARKLLDDRTSAQHRRARHLGDFKKDICVWIPHSFPYKGVSSEWTLPYYRTDGMRPNWSNILKMMSKLWDMKHCQEFTYMEAQEAFQKDIKRTSGLSVISFQNFKEPCRLLYTDNLALMMKKCTFLHTMNVEYQREPYDYGMWASKQLEREKRFFFSEKQTFVWKLKRVTRVMLGSYISTSC